MIGIDYSHNHDTNNASSYYLHQDRLKEDAAGGSRDVPWLHAANHLFPTTYRKRATQLQGQHVKPNATALGNMPSIMEQSTALTLSKLMADPQVNEPSSLMIITNQGETCT